MLMHLDMNTGSFNSPGWCVRVDCQGIAPQQFNCPVIGELFHGCVGEYYALCARRISGLGLVAHTGGVTGATEHFESGKKWIKVAFGGEDELKKALRMSGYTIGDTSIQVTSLSSRPPHAVSKPKAKSSIKLKRDSDARRNLYVLNLPHDLSAQAYRDLFIAHGTPTHTVLLKTQDSCSRRRGFVVMSTHEEAHNVIHWLDGICIRGFQLRVTWANIDRSNGFMSGYDRTTFLGQNSNSSSDPLAPASNVSLQKQKSPGIGVDTSTVVASNIPVSLFPAHEIDCLFRPFGTIKNIQLIPSNPSSENTLSTLAPASPLAQTAIVTYERADDAIAAKYTLHGQIYEGFALAVGFVSKLGVENYHAPGPTSAPPSVTPKFSPLVHSPVPSSVVCNTHHTIPSLEFGETFRGLPVPVDLHDAPMQLQYESRFIPTSQSTYNNWPGYSSFAPQGFTRHIQKNSRVSPQYIPNPAILHHQFGQHNGSHVIHQLHAFEMS